jgi:hypothetical protein
MTIIRCNYSLIFEWEYEYTKEFQNDFKKILLPIMLPMREEYPFKKSIRFGICALNKKQICRFCFDLEASVSSPPCNSKRQYRMPSFLEIFGDFIPNYKNEPDIDFLAPEKIKEMQERVNEIKEKGERRINRPDSLTGVDAFIIQLGRKKKILL